MLLKPASQTPLTALKLAGLMARAGLPPGYLSVLPGPAAPIGDVLIDDPRVRLVTFTGSAEVGWGIRARAPRKRVALELGNTSPAIVTADADLDRAAELLAANGYSYAGQACVSVQRIVVARSVYGKFRDRFLEAVARLPVGNPLDESTHVGPLISRAERDRVTEWIEEARVGGAEVAVGGRVRGELLVCRRPSSPVACRRPSPLPARCSSAGCSSTKRRPGGPTRCPMAVSRRAATRVRPRCTPCAR